MTPASERTRQRVDDEVRRIVDEAHDNAALRLWDERRPPVVRQRAGKLHTIFG